MKTKMKMKMRTNLKQAIYSSTTTTYIKMKP
jgi:hypothetical protein